MSEGMSKGIQSAIPQDFREPLGTALAFTPGGGVARAISQGKSPLSIHALPGVGQVQEMSKMAGVQLPSFMSTDAAKPDQRSMIGGSLNRSGSQSEAQNLANIAAAREADLKRGSELGQSLFGANSLGRMAEGRDAEISGLVGTRQSQAGTAGQQSADIADVLARRRAGLEGLNSNELAAARSQTLQNVGQGEQTALRQLRAQQAASGVRGGAAMGQQAAALQGFQNQRAQGERDLFLANVAQKQQALGALEQSATGAETNQFNRQQIAQTALENMVQQGRQEELARQQFNIGQGQQEKFGQLAAQMGIASLGAAERGSAAQTELGRQQLAASKQLASQGKGGMFG